MKISSKNYLNRFFSTLLAFMVVLSLGATSAFAAEQPPQAISSVDGSVTFSNLDNMKIGDVLEYDVIDRNGDPATISIERVGLHGNNKEEAGKATSTAWKVSYTGVVINCRFYMTVSNNKVTSVYDDWILIIGGSYDNASLTKTSTYGKLSFKVTAYAGIMSAKCWLKGTVTGSGNDITVSYQM